MEVNKMPLYTTRIACRMHSQWRRWNQCKNKTRARKMVPWKQHPRSLHHWFRSWLTGHYAHDDKIYKTLMTLSVGMVATHGDFEIGTSTQWYFENGSNAATAKKVMNSNHQCQIYRRAREIWITSTMQDSKMKLRTMSVKMFEKMVMAM